MTSRLIRQYERNDLRTLSDNLATYFGNVEDAFITVGQKAGVDYTFSDILRVVCAVIQSPRLADCDLTLKDVDRTEEAKKMEGVNLFNANYVSALNLACDPSEKLDTRTLSCLEKANLNTLSDVYHALATEQLRWIPNSGVKTVQRVSDWVKLCISRRTVDALGPRTSI